MTKEELAQLFAPLSVFEHKINMIPLSVESWIMENTTDNDTIIVNRISDRIVSLYNKRNNMLYILEPSDLEQVPK